MAKKNSIYIYKPSLYGSICATNAEMIDLLRLQALRHG